MDPEYKWGAGAYSPPPVKPAVNPAPTKSPVLVVLESPYGGDVDANVEYARDAVRDSLKRGEAPIASHLLYTQRGILDDNTPSERAMGMQAGWAWYPVAQLCVVYVDRGISGGMISGMIEAQRHGVPVEFRRIGE